MESGIRCTLRDSIFIRVATIFVNIRFSKFTAHKSWLSIHRFLHGCLTSAFIRVFRKVIIFATPRDLIFSQCVCRWGKYLFCVKFTKVYTLSISEKHTVSNLLVDRRIVNEGCRLCSCWILLVIDCGVVCLIMLGIFDYLLLIDWLIDNTILSWLFSKRTFSIFVSWIKQCSTSFEVFFFI